MTFSAISKASQSSPGLTPSGTAAESSFAENKIAVIGAVLIFLMMVAGIITTTIEQRKAQRRFNDVRELANSFLFEFHDAIKDLPGSTPARELVTNKALEYLDRLAAKLAEIERFNASWL
jgi:hypothetical protein